MKIKNCLQQPQSVLSDLPIDLLICCSGYEERATFIASQVKLNSISERVAFSFKNETNSIKRANNDLFYQSNAFNIIHADGDSSREISSFLNNLNSHKKKNLNVLIDYSSMTRIWYSAILSHFLYCKNFEKINLYFGYSMSKFTPSLKIESYNIHIGPIRGFSNLTIPQKPTALLIGLGYEKNRALGLNEYFDGETFVFYTDKSKEERFSIEVENNNAILLSQLKKNNICQYPINDLNYLYSRLLQLCKDLSNDYRVIIAPCGPKPFSLLSLVLALDQKQIDVWRISAGKSAIPVDKMPNGDISLFLVSCEN